MNATELSPWGQSVERRREDAGLTLQELADLAGLDKSTLWRRLRARTLSPRQQQPVEAALHSAPTSLDVPRTSVNIRGDWSGVVEMIADAVARALRHVVVKEEMGDTRRGRTALIAILRSLRSDLILRGYDASDIEMAIEYISKTHDIYGGDQGRAKGESAA